MSNLNRSSPSLLPRGEGKDDFIGTRDILYPKQATKLGHIPFNCLTHTRPGSSPIDASFSGGVLRPIAKASGSGKAKTAPSHMRRQCNSPESELLSLSLEYTPSGRNGTENNYITRFPILPFSYDIEFLTEPFSDLAELPIRKTNSIFH